MSMKEIDVHLHSLKMLHCLMSWRSSPDLLPYVMIKIQISLRLKWVSRVYLLRAECSPPRCRLSIDSRNNDESVFNMDTITNFVMLLQCYWRESCFVGFIWTLSAVYSPFEILDSDFSIGIQSTSQVLMEWLLYLFSDSYGRGLLAGNFCLSTAGFFRVCWYSPWITPCNTMSSRISVSGGKMYRSL